jgi:predicted ATP-dependent serine protease
VEAEKMGFRRALVPHSARLAWAEHELKAVPAATLVEAVRLTVG